MAKQVGRPTSFKPEYVAQVFDYCLLGAKDSEIAEIFGVSEQTLNNWKAEFPEFLESMLEGKEKADAKVARALYNRSTGAEWTEEQAFKVKRVGYEDGKKAFEEEEVITVPVKRAAPPDTAAASLWLRNRQSGKWREKVIGEISGPDGGPIEISGPESVLDEARAIAFALRLGQKAKDDLEKE